MKLNDKLKYIKGEIIIELRDAKTGKLKSRDIIHNMFVTAGKNSIAAALNGDTNKGQITYCAVGTSSVAPALGDTGLTTEIQRKLVSVRSVVGNVATFQTYFATGEGNGSLREAGLFGDIGTNGASSTPGSGTLYAKAAINRTKTINDTLTITWNMTVG